jgi:hypothetical protein
MVFGLALTISYSTRWLLPLTGGNSVQFIAFSLPIFF